MRVPNGDDPLPNRAGESWRAWLMTGARRGPVDRRRVRGSHVGIKKMLVEGMAVRSEKPYTWKEFSDAMVRQAVGDAMRNLAPDDSQLVKLAYFGGLTNRELADHMRMTEATVQRRLRLAVEAISRFVERGRGLGQRILAGFVVWLCGRSAGDVLHSAVQGAVVATAVAVVATHPAVIVAQQHLHATPPATAAPAAPVVPPVPSPTVPESTGPAAQLPSVSAPTLPVNLPIKLPKIPQPLRA